MNKLSFLIILIFIVSCSTSPFRESKEHQGHVVEHLAEGVQYVEGRFDDKYYNPGRNGIYLTAVGKAVYPLSRKQGIAEEAAISAARFKIVESGPTDFKIMVQKAIGNHLGDVGDFSKIETSVTEVKALTGIKVSHKDIQCKIRTEPTSNGGYDNSRECRAIAKVKMSDLLKAYDFTIKQKYKKKVDKKKIKSDITLGKVPAK